MSRAGASSVDASSAIVEVIPLEQGWEAVGVTAGSADERLLHIEGEFLPARVPGTAAQALGAEHRDADLDEQDWWFRLRFDGPPAEPDTETVLRLDGIATLADVWLNGERILSSENMHTRHVVGVDGLLARENELVVGIRALVPKLRERRPRPRWRTRVVREQGLRWFRTSLIGRAAALGGGPAPVGPWRPVMLERRRRIAVDELRLRTTLADGTGTASLALRARALGQFRPTSARFIVEGPSGSYASELTPEREGTTYSLDGGLDVPEVEPWWPHTHGRPALYGARVEIEGDDGHTIVLDCGAIGFRSLGGAPGCEDGLTVNGVPIFCRGASLMPRLQSVDVTGDGLQRLVELARDAGMNMLRLSGVWSYGSSELYGICDRLGMLVWQDFPFANMDYPIADDAFRVEVERECRGFLQSAGEHPSLVVLGGNSEVEQQVEMLGLGSELGRGPLFDELLPALIREEAVDAAYVRSSPSGGEPAFRSDEGVAHYFGVGAYRRPLDDARRAGVRFAAECLAFANVPGDELLEEIVGHGAAAVHGPAWKAAVPRDGGASWDFEDVRDDYLKLVFDLDPVDLRQTDPERYVAISRVLTGEVMADVLGEWRRSRSPCRGALIWWLNDAKPSMGWGVIDAHDRPKTSYWFVRRAFAPIAVWMTDEGTNGVAIHLANDTDRTVKTTLDVALYRDLELCVDFGTIELALTERTVTERTVEEVLGHFADAGYAFRFGPPGHDLVVATLRSEDEILSESFFFPLGRPSEREPIARLGFSASAEPETDGSLRVTLKSNKLAYAVALDVPGHVVSDDHVSIAPGGQRVVKLRPVAPGVVLDGNARPLNAHGATHIEFLDS